MKKMGDRGRILLIRLSSLGDVVLSTAALEAIRDELPGVTVDVLVKPDFAEIFAGHPVVERIIEWEPGCSPVAMARRLGAMGYDRVVDLHANLRTRLLRLFMRGPRWSVYNKGALRRRLALKLGRPEWLEQLHVVDRYIGALGELGVSARRQLPRMEPSNAARERVTGLLVQAGWDETTRLVALAPGARWATKGWPQDKWVALVRRIEREGVGVPVLLGGPEEAGLAEDISQAAGASALVVAGQTTVTETAALLSMSDVLVTNDSAPMHLATAVSTPVVAIFGPTVRGFGFYPLGPCDAVAERTMVCRPCTLHGGDACPLGHFRCMEELEPDDVMEQLMSVLECDRSRRGGSQ